MLTTLPPEAIAVPFTIYVVAAFTDNHTVKCTIALVAGAAISHLKDQKPLTVKEVFCKENAEIAVLSAATARVMHTAAPHLPLLNRPELPHLVVGGLFFLAGALVIKTVRGAFPALRGL